MVQLGRMVLRVWEVKDLCVYGNISQYHYKIVANVTNIKRLPNYYYYFWGYDSKFECWNIVKYYRNDYEPHIRKKINKPHNYQKERRKKNVGGSVIMSLTNYWSIQKW